MDPEQAALAAEILDARRLVPMHYGGYALEGLYEPVGDELARVRAASERVHALEIGETIALLPD